MKIALSIWFVLFAQFTYAEDIRFCGIVYRDKVTHDIIRSATPVAAFKKEWPCPNRALNPASATCSTGWQVDHIIPLDCGGCDRAANMQWLPISIKTCALPSLCKDRWERKVYCGKQTSTIYK